MYGEDMMPNWNPAIIVVKSRQGDEASEQRIKGESLIKGNAVYIRYVEPERGPTGGVTRATVKISKDELKVMRHGEVESEQTFQQGRRLPGFYKSPFTRFNLSTDTSRLEFNLNGPYGVVTWEYDLLVHEEMTGHFVNSLHIQEEA
ncbi:putative beta-barrel protein YwiB [compost metagenome]